MQKYSIDYPYCDPTGFDSEGNDCGASCGHGGEMTPDSSGAYYLASEVDARIDGYTDLLRRAGIALAAEEGPAKKAFVTKLYQDMHDFNTVDVNHERLDRIAELEKALRWHVGERHDKFCLIQEGRSTCNCGHDLLQR